MIDRRTLMTSAAAAGAALTLDLGTARAAAPVVGKQVPGIYRYKIGDFEITSINDGIAPRPLDEGFVKNVPFADVKKELESSFQPTDKVPITFCTTVINTGSKLLVIDSGFADNGPASAGNMVANLKAAGIEPAAVDTVILSHFHPDHIYGIRKKDGALTYPNAEILAPAPELAFWMDDAKMAQAPEGMKGNFAGIRRAFGADIKNVRPYEWNKEIAPGLTSIDAKGHTPGHTAFFLQSGSGKLLITSDCSNLPAYNLRNPEWRLVFDMNPDDAIASRRKLYDMAASERVQAVGYHWPFPATGYIVKDGPRYQLVPVAWSPVI